MGQNGNGKSTFIRLLSDRLKPREGRIKRTSKLRVGYFSQDQEEGLDYEATPFQHMASALGPGAGETKVRAQLGRFGFSRDRADLKVGVLSGGEKTRLLLSLATRNAPHLLLLDEPTNHLDMDARASLVDAINDFDGAVVLVSHDTHLVKMVADQLWVVADGKVTPFDGDIDDYQAKLLRERNGGRNGKAGKREREAAAAVQAARPRTRAQEGTAQAVGRYAGQARAAQEDAGDAGEGYRQAQQAARRPRGQAGRARDLQPTRRSTSPIYSARRSGWSARSPTPSTNGWWRRKPTRRRNASCHPERSEGHFEAEREEVPRYARDDSFLEFRPCAIPQRRDGSPPSARCYCGSRSP